MRLVSTWKAVNMYLGYNQAELSQPLEWKRCTRIAKTGATSVLRTTLEAKFVCHSSTLFEETGCVRSLYEATYERMVCETRGLLFT